MSGGEFQQLIHTVCLTNIGVLISNSQFSTGGSTKASVSWSLDLSDTDLRVVSVGVMVTSSCFQDGHVVWVLCGDDEVVLLTPGVMNKTTLMAGSKRVCLGASLTGGRKNVSRLDTQVWSLSSFEVSRQLLTNDLKESSFIRFIGGNYHGTRL